MLSEQEKLALAELRLRPTESYWAEKTLAAAMLRLFPPGWDEPVTVEGLVALGGVRTGLGSVQAGWWVDFSEGVSFRFVSDSLNDVMMNHIYWMSDISEALIPRNMKEAREILERCGAIETNRERPH